MDRGNRVARGQSDDPLPARVEEYIRSDDERAGPVLRKRRKRAIQFVVATGFDHENPLPDRMRGSLQCVRLSLAIGTTWVDEHADQSRLRYQIAQQAQALILHSANQQIHTGHIATWLIKTYHQAGLDWIVASDEYNRDRRGGGLGRERGGRAERGNDFRIPPHQIGGHRGKPIELALCPAIFDRHIAPFGIAVFAQSSPKHTQPGREHIARASIEEPDHRHRRLLRACRERPSSRRAAEQRDELAPSDHSITSSARTSSAVGTVRPRVLAVLRVKNSSTLVPCSTGSSPGFSPLRIRAA